MGRRYALRVIFTIGVLAWTIYLIHEPSTARTATFPPGDWAQWISSTEVALSPDGRFVATGHLNSVRIWTRDNTLVAAYESEDFGRHYRSVLLWSRDSRRLVVPSYRSATMIDVPSGRVHWNVGNSARFTRDMTRVAINDQHGTRVIDISSGQNPRELAFYEGMAPECWSADGTRLMMRGIETNEASIAKPGEPAVPQGVRVEYNDGRLSPDGRYAAALGNPARSFTSDNTHVWAVEAPREVRTTTQALDLVWNPSGTRVAMRTYKGLTLVDVDCVSNLVLIPDLASARIVGWDSAGQNVFVRQDVPAPQPGPILEIFARPDRDITILLKVSNAGQVTKVLTVPGDSNKTDLAVSPDGTTVAWIESSGRVGVAPIDPQPWPRTKWAVAAVGLLLLAALAFRTLRRSLHLRRSYKAA